MYAVDSHSVEHVNLRYSWGEVLRRTITSSDSTSAGIAAGFSPSISGLQYNDNKKDEQTGGFV